MISAPAIARTVYLHRGTKAYPIKERTPIAGVKDDTIKMDANIGTIKVLSPTAFMWFSRLSSFDGGLQSILVIKNGYVYGGVRRFTNPKSRFGFADYYGRSVLVRGTEYLVEVVEGKMITIVESSRVIADNGKGVTMPLLSGQGATINDDGIRQFRVGYDLSVEQGKTQVLSDGKTQIFSGWVEPWLKIEVDGQTISPGLNGYFKVKTRSHYYDVVHPFGLTRRIYPDGAARDHFGSH